MFITQAGRSNLFLILGCMTYNHCTCWDELFHFAVLIIYEELMPSSLLNYISPPSLLSPLSNVFEINNPPGWPNRGFTVTIELL